MHIVMHAVESEGHGDSHCQWSKAMVTHKQPYLLPGGGEGGGGGQGAVECCSTQGQVPMTTLAVNR